jgi:hypothetical protein
MSIKKTIFKAIGTHLMDKVKDLPNNLPDLKHYDKQMGQFTSPELALVLPLPTVLLQFLPFTWETVGQNTQKGTGIIRVTVYFENYANSFTGSINQDTALAFFEFTEAVHQALQGYALDSLAPLSRVGDAEDTEQDMIIMSEMDYQTTIIDSSTDERRNFIDADPELHVEYKKESSRPAPTNNNSFLL